MTMTWRAYREPDDLASLIELVQRMPLWNAGGVGFLHPGDVTWRLYQNLATIPEDEFRIVTDADGAPLALAEFQPPGDVYLHIPSNVQDPEAVLRFALAEAEAEMRALPPGEGEEPPDSLTTEILDSQSWAGDVLRSLGYSGPETPDYRINWQDLDGEVTSPVLADGAIVRAVRDDPDDLAARVEVHCSVWNPSKFTLEGYERLRAKPPYRADLDLVVETPDGELAAYCIVWWDPETRTGEFEPVGTVERFRGRGYGKAILREGLRRLRDLGATGAMVINSMDEEFVPSQRLYASAGFTPATVFLPWKKPLREG